MNVGLLLAVVISAAVLLVCLVVATAVVLRAVRAASRRLEEVFGELRWVTKGSERSVRVLADMQHTVTELVSRSTQIAELVSRSSQPEESRRSTEVSDSRIVAELNHALQTPLRGLGYAVQNLARVSDELLLQERTKRLADLTAMLDSCTSTLATFRGLADTVASVPARQPSLDEAIRVFSDSIPRRSSEPVTVEFAGLPDRVDKFTNHYLLTMLQLLVENAIEGCVPGGRVEITFADYGDAVEFTVFNPTVHPVDREVLFKPGRTTKEGHQGLGFSIVERLVDFCRGELTVDITEADMRARVLLPRR